MTGICAVSAKRLISSPAPDQNAPLPATIKGRSAAASAATAPPMSAGDPAGRCGVEAKPDGATSSGAALP
jgi:hypothetical protein